MCGIFAVFAKKDTVNVKKHGKRLRTLRELAYSLSGRQRHRGPDHTGVVDVPEYGVVIIQERLSIVGVETGDQPLKSENENIILAVNGEIYNYLELSDQLRKRRGQYEPRSDSDVIIALYEEFGEILLEHIRGMFAFVMYDKSTKEILIARDPLGIIPLYRGEDEDGNLWIASEMKCLVGVCNSVEVFPPGSSMFGKIDNLKEIQYYQPQWMHAAPTNCPVDLSALEQHLVNAVRTHLQCDSSVPFGALLSGGVDSSLIASIATKVLREKEPGFRLKTYSVGLENAPDFAYSRLVAEYLNSDHKEIIFKVEDALDCIRDIIYHVETYDVTTVRCSIPMTILARTIKAEGIKMILSGEGADEIFGGYLYFFNAPDKNEFHIELVKRVLALHYSDCQRANKSAMTYGLELRVPFLDTNFVDHAMSINAEDKMPRRMIPNGKQNGCTENGFSLNGITENGHSSDETSARIEKHILRAAFANNYLPDEVLWRQKEQFSDGVGYSWIDTIRSTAAAQISDEEFSIAARTYQFNTPSTKEAYYYRSVFEELFPGETYARTVMRWIPRMDWGCSEDPSGRAQHIHTSAYTEKV